jgi:hypothetical protein
MKKHIIAASVLAGISLLVASVKADTVATPAVPSTSAITTPSQGMGDFALAIAKFAASYIQTNGSQSASSGFTGFGTGHIKVAPVLSQSLTFASVGKQGVDQLTFGVEHATSFQPNANKECLGLDMNWHLWKNSKVGRIIVIDFNDAGLAAGVDAPVEWATGKGIRGSDLVLRVGVFAHF